MRKVINETGNRYGRLLVLERSESDEHGNARWLCRCDCANEVIVLGASLRRGHTNSCGCFKNERSSKTNTIDITGNRYARLSVVRRRGTNKFGAAMWLCKCDCGNEVTVVGNNLRKGATKSCGCLQRECARELKSLPKGVAYFNALVSMMKGNAKTRSLEWQLTREQVRHLTKRSCHYCGAEPSQVLSSRKYSGTYAYNGLDRVDNDKGYTIDNVVPCCFVCNRAKGNLTTGEFYAWIERVYTQHTTIGGK